MDRVAGRLGDSRKMAGVLEKEDKSVKRGKKMSETASWDKLLTTVEGMCPKDVVRQVEHLLVYFVVLCLIPHPIPSKFKCLLCMLHIHSSQRKLLYSFLLGIKCKTLAYTWF